MLIYIDKVFDINYTYSIKNVFIKLMKIRNES